MRVAAWANHSNRVGVRRPVEREPGSDVLAGQGGVDLVGGGEDDGDAGSRRDAGGSDLGDHAPGADTRDLLARPNVAGRRRDLSLRKPR